MASLAKDKNGNIIGVRAYAGIDPVTKQTRNLYRPVARNATQAEVESALSQIQTLANFARRQGLNPTIGAMVHFYVDYLEACGASPTTVDSYRSNTRCYIDPFIGSEKLDAADVPMFTSLYFTLLTKGGKNGRPISANTVLKFHSWLKGCFGFFCDNGFIASNPITAVKNLPSYEKPDIEVIDEEDYKALLSYLTSRIADGKATALDYAIYIDMGTGIREGEIAALDIRDFSSKNSELFIQKSLAESRKKIRKKSLKMKSTKSKKSRAISLDKNRTIALEKHIAIQKERLADRGIKQTASTPLFAKSDGSRYRPRTFNDYLKRIVKKLDLSPRIHFHCIRHTHATILLERCDVSLIAIQNRFGHYSSSVTLDNYGHVLLSNDTRSAESFNKFEEGVMWSDEQD